MRFMCRQREMCSACSLSAHTRKRINVGIKMLGQFQEHNNVQINCMMQRSSKSFLKLINQFPRRLMCGFIFASCKLSY